MGKWVSENSGLCVTCDNASDCMYVGDAEHPVMQCEQFSQRGREPAAPRAEKNLSERLDEEVEEFLAIGLCANCARRTTCTLPKPPGGVWQCDAYC